MTSVRTHAPHAPALRRTPRTVLTALCVALLGLSCTSTDGRDELLIDVRPFTSLAIDSVDLLERVPAISSTGYIAAQLLAPPSGGVGLFDQQGRFVKRIANAGGGPGELRDVSAAGFGPGDTLWIIDQNRTLHAFSPPPTLSYVRTVHVERPMSGEVTRVGLLTYPAMWGQGKSSFRLLPPMLIGWDGTETARFGAEGLWRDADEDRMGMVYAIDSSQIWWAMGNAYAVERVSKDGAMTGRIARTVDWFPPGLSTKGLPWEARPRPQITSISVDSVGRVWLLIRRANANWAADSTRTASRPGPVSRASLPSRFDLSQYFETVIEVFDPSTGALLASSTISATIFGFAAPGILCEVGETEDGRATISLLSVSLQDVARSAQRR
jgi:hypothetical protein